MLAKLGDSLGGWSPRRGAGDPLTAIRTRWAALAGSDVARAAQPVAIVDDTLVVVTTSSSWSHQLAFLEPHILSGIREQAGVTSVTRLRFRVGVIRTKRREERSAGGSRAAAAVPSLAAAAPRTASEAFARFRAAVERSRAAHRASGGTFCMSCAAPIAGGRQCHPCHQWARAEREAACQRLLFDAPWLSSQEVLASIGGLDPADYDGIRRRLLRSWWDEMALARKRASLARPVMPDRQRLCKIASSYVLLETKIDPQRLEMDSPIRRNALGDLYDFIRAVEQTDRQIPARAVQKSSAR